MSEFRFPAIDDYTLAYREGRSTPLQVARRFIEQVERSDALSPPLRAFIARDPGDLLRQAEASTARHDSHQPLSALDGVPIAVKDEIDQQGYPTSVGTTFLGARPVEHDATVVARLRAAGALLVGKANMHEVGIGVTGINPHHGSARNPYDPNHITGGSSSGSAAAVASGLCPVAIGADGGGSIRIPAGLCGVSGIKPTFGRVSEAGAAPLCWSLAHIGPLAGSLADAARVLQIIAGPDPADPHTMVQPELVLPPLMPGSLDGIRIGWCEPWCAEARPDVLHACRQAVDRLTAVGAELLPVRIEHLEWVQLVEYVTIGVEIAASQHEHRRTSADKHRYGADVRLLLEMASRLPAVDYVRAQRLRALVQQGFDRALKQVDLLVTPTTASTAPPLLPDAERCGQQDDDVLRALTAFSFAPNLTGLPALTVPVGYDGAGLPIGLQIIGRHFDECTAIRAGLVVEHQLQRRPPQILCPPL